MVPSRAAALGLLAACAALAGCAGEKTPLTGATVSGVVRKGGAPIGGGSIRLVDPADPNKSMSGNILGDGTYTVPNAPVGEVVAVVETESAKTDPRKLLQALAAKGEKIDPKDMPPGPPLKYVPIDKKYADPARTPLRVTVNKGDNQKDFEVD